jgi:Tfp pilus assembly protein PilO
VPDNLTYQKKSIVLLGAFVLFLILGYKLSFHNTFTVIDEISQKEEKLKWLKEKESEIPFLKSKMALIEEAYTNDSTSIRDKLTAFISDYAESNSCVVTEIPTFTAYVSDNLYIQSNTFTVKGRFNELASLLKAIESKFRVSAKVMSAHFYTIEDMQTKRNNLYLTLITQSFNQKESK